jgi:hypothetical protein
MQNHAKHLSRFLCGLLIVIVSAAMALNPKTVSAFPEHISLALGQYTIYDSTNHIDQVPVSVTLHNYPSDTINLFYTAYGANNVAATCTPSSETISLSKDQTYQGSVLVAQGGATTPVRFSAEAQGVNGGDDQMQQTGLGAFPAGPFVFGNITGHKRYTVQVNVATANEKQDNLRLDYTTTPSTPHVTLDRAFDTFFLGPNTSKSTSVKVNLVDASPPIFFTMTKNGDSSITVSYPLFQDPASQAFGQLTLGAGPTFHVGDWTVPIDSHLHLSPATMGQPHANMKVFFSARDTDGNDFECTPAFLTPLTYNQADQTWNGPASVRVDGSGKAKRQVQLTAILVLYDNGGNQPPTFIEPASRSPLFGP